MAQPRRPPGGEFIATLRRAGRFDLPAGPGGTDQFDLQTVIERRVGQGEAPDRVEARRGVDDAPSSQCVIE